MSARSPIVPGKDPVAGKDPIAGIFTAGNKSASLADKGDLVRKASDKVLEENDKESAEEASQQKVLADLSGARNEDSKNGELIAESANVGVPSKIKSGIY